MSLSRSFSAPPLSSPKPTRRSAVDLIIPPRSSPIALDAVSISSVTVSSFSPVKPNSVLISAIALATVAASCGTVAQTSLKDSVSPSNASPVAPVPAAIVLVASWYSSPSFAAAPAARVIPPAAIATPFRALPNFAPMPLTFASAVDVSASTVMLTVLATRLVLHLALAHD